MPDVAILSRRFALGARPALRFCRGGLPSVRVRRCGSGAAICPRFAPGVAVLARRFSFGSRPALHLYRGGLPSAHARRCGSGAAFAIGSRLLFAAWRQTGRLAISCVPIPQVEIAIGAFSQCPSVICLCGFTSGLYVSLWRSRRGTEDAGDGERGTENGSGGAAFVRFCTGALALLRFPRGVRWGCAPQTAPKSLRLSGLSSRCGEVVLVQIRSLCTLLHNHIGLAMLSAGRTLGLNVEAALRPPQTAPKSRMWKRHCRLSGLSSRCGGVTLVRIRAFVTRVHEKTRPALIYGRAGRAVLRCYQLAQSETCLTLIYGQAGRVSLRGSKWKPALPAIWYFCRRVCPPPSGRGRSST